MEQYKKGDEIKSFEVVNGKAISTFVLGGLSISNPTIEAIEADGWMEYIPPTPKPYIPTLEELVQDALRNGADGGTPTYSIPQEFEVQRKRDEDPDAFVTYNARVEACIAWANAQPHRDAEEGV